MFSSSFFLLLAVEAERAHERLVAHRENNRRLFMAVFVAVRLPHRRDERIALLPVEALVPDERYAAASEDIIDRRARVAVRERLLARADHLDRAVERRQRGPAGQRIDVIENDAVVGIAGPLADAFECLLGVVLDGEKLWGGVLLL